MHAKRRFGLVVAVSTLLTGINGSALAASDQASKIKHMEGAQLYKRYDCASCHGQDGKSAVKQGIPEIAGLEVDYLFKAMAKMGPEGPKELHKPMKGDEGGCEEPMSKPEMDAISVWLGSL